MVFSSIPFLFFFLPIVLIFYYLAPRRLKNAILLLFSLIFYAWGEPVYVLLMIGSIVANFWFGLRLDRARRTASSQPAKTWLIVSIIFNVSLLGFFKYADFLISNVNTLTNSEIGRIGLPLPIGISFYTFQIMSYVIDLYRGKVWVQTSIIDLGAYVALFPQLIAGPIVRIRDVAEALRSRKENVSDFAEGVSRFVTGLAKKVLFANAIGVVWSEIQAMPFSSLSTFTAWLGILAFSFQIYFDFSAYSDMAIGLGLMFGFRFLENFNYPYIATSITDFWRRWHISLSSWFREYVYIPLGGNRKGLGRQIINLFVVWLLTGLWHGASWNFVLWGLYFFILLMIEKAFLLKWLQRLPAVIGHIYTLFFVVISWVIFSFERMTDVASYLSSMFGLNGQPAIDNVARYHLLSNLALLLILAIASTPLPKMLFTSLQTRFQEKPIPDAAFFTLRLLSIVALLVLVNAHLVDAGFNPFLYFRF